MGFSWKYSFYDSDFVADERWQKLKLTTNWLPMIVRDPLPFLAALWARIAEIGIVNVFVTTSILATLLFNELNDRAEEMSQDCKTAQYFDVYSESLEKWRRHYNLVCRFVEQINSCFSPILLIEIGLGFAVPIFEFQKLFNTNWQKARFYFEFVHTIFRFLVTLLNPSYSLTKQVYHQ